MRPLLHTWPEGAEVLSTEVRKLRAEGFHYVAFDYGQLCLTCATDFDLVGELTFAAEGSCYNCGPDDLESQRQPVKRRRRRDPLRGWRGRLRSGR
jgi:hypothetical protein